MESVSRRVSKQPVLKRNGLHPGPSVHTIPRYFPGMNLTGGFLKNRKRRCEREGVVVGLLRGVGNDLTARDPGHSKVGHGRGDEW